MGGSLDWDEFQPVSKECSPWKEQHIPSATVSMEDLLCTASFPANTSTVADGLDKLLSAIPPAQLAFNASPIQEVFYDWLKYILTITSRWTRAGKKPPVCWAVQLVA